MIGDIEEIKKKLIHGLSNNECEIDEITIDSSYGEITNTSCRVTLKERPDYGFTGGWTRPPKKSYIDPLNRNWVIDEIHDYCHRDWMNTMNAYKRSDKDNIKKVIFNNPATIVFWGDGTKTVVKCNEDEFDPEKGLAMAIAKHFMGTNKSKSNYYKSFEKWVPKKEETIEEEVTLYFDNQPIVTTRTVKAKTDEHGILMDAEEHKSLYNVDKFRICSECGKMMTKGYCIHDGEEYYCSAECLNKNISVLDYNKIYEAEEAYYTEWDD